MKIFVTNFKRKFTGVTTTAFTVAQSHARDFGQDVTLVGEGLGQTNLSVISAKQMRTRFGALVDGQPAVLHVRRDSEMWFSLYLRDVLRKPVKLVFTSSNMVRRSWIGRWLMARMDGVIATTQTAANVLPVPAAGIVPHGVDLERFALKKGVSVEGRRTLACVGRVREGKGTHNFVQAFIQAAQNSPSLHAIAFGMIKPEDRAFQGGLQDELVAAGLADRFTWAGEVSHEQMIPRLMQCDVLVALPEYEPFGVTPLEAMAMGLPAVCSKTGCYTDLIADGENGFLVEHNDTASAANAISRVLTWPLDEQSFRAKMRSFVEQGFSQRAEAAGVLEVYKTVLG